VYKGVQIDALARHLQRKLMNDEAEGYEIVITLMALVKDNKIQEKDIRPMLMTIYFNNVEGVMRALKRAHQLIDEEMIDSVLKDVRDARS
jgi:uncharacterized protein YqgV (UPF0045/DUF77 family)